MSFTLPEFVKDAGERAIKAFAGAVLSTLGLGVVDILHTNWEAALSVGGGAALVSVLMSLGSLTIANTMSPASVVPTAPAPVVPAVTAADVDKAINAALTKVILGTPETTTLAPIPVAAQLPPGPQFGAVAMSVPGVVVNPAPVAQVAPAEAIERLGTTLTAENFKPDVARVATARTKRAFVTPKSPVVAPIAPATKPVPEALAAAWKLDAATTGT